MHFDNLSFKLNNDFVWRLMLSMCAILMVLIISEEAFAATVSSGASSDVIGATLCRLVKNLSGGIAKGIATIAIFSVGVGLFLGKLNWGIAAATAVGVGIIFSAPNLVNFLAGDVGATDCPTE